MTAGVRILRIVPFVDDLLAAGAVLTGIGAGVLTPFGLKRFRPSTPHRLTPGPAGPRGRPGRATVRDLGKAG